ncbi:MAG: endonuclease/exonuclease/phosphatase family protein [Syntrophorhabdaceae bacterium]
MTYNTHSSVGTDRVTSPSRIADVIMEYAPDIVALQELDIGLDRTGSVDQAQFIADRIRMDYHFHPSLFIEEGQYGNAVLTHFPMRVVKASLLPGLPGRTKRDKRGALWVDIDIGNRIVQVVAVHMGLNRSERLAQAMELAGSEWLTSDRCRDPVILCGDLNSFPSSRVHRIIRTCMKDAHACTCTGTPQATWPGKYPFARLDYIYVSEGISILDCSVLKSPLIRRASDHLPLMARLRVQDAGGD